MQRAVVLFTGVPNSGKSTMMREFLETLKTRGIRTGAVNDVNFFDEWAGQEGNKRFWMQVGDTYDLKPEAYHGVSLFSVFLFLTIFKL